MEIYNPTEKMQQMPEHSDKNAVDNAHRDTSRLLFSPTNGGKSNAHSGQADKNGGMSKATDTAIIVVECNKANINEVDAENEAGSRAASVDTADVATLPPASRAEGQADDEGDEPESDTAAKSKADVAGGADTNADPPAPTPASRAEGQADDEGDEPESDKPAGNQADVAGSTGTNAGSVLIPSNDADPTADEHVASHDNLPPVDGSAAPTWDFINVVEMGLIDVIDIASSVQNGKEKAASLLTKEYEIARRGQIDTSIADLIRKRTGVRLTKLNLNDISTQTAGIFFHGREKDELGKIKDSRSQRSVNASAIRGLLARFPDGAETATIMAFILANGGVAGCAALDPKRDGERLAKSPGNAPEAEQEERASSAASGNSEAGDGAVLEPVSTNITQADEIQRRVADYMRGRAGPRTLAAIIDADSDGTYRVLRVVEQPHESSAGSFKLAA
ncbi:MAG: hypothetical protein WCJ64_11930 [Rhodospirillaceae bacterium]